MQERAFERIGSSLMAKFLCADSIYYGVATNLSENGMCFKTVMNLSSESIPVGSSINIFIHLNEERLEIPVKVVRIAKTMGFCDTMGVELLKQPPNYLEFIKRFKSYTG